MYTREFHKSIENDEYPQAVRLAEYISKYMKCDSFIDFGCSTGLYLREIQLKMPTISTTGYEFSKDAVDNALCKNIVQVDLTNKLEAEKTPNTLGLCLEVLEHIDEQNSKAVLENIVSMCDKLIFSAAIPGQGGVGHINCRPKIDWIKKFHELGWVVDLDATQHLLNFMKGGYRLGWFISNAMVLIPYAN